MCVRARVYVYMHTPMRPCLSFCLSVAKNGNNLIAILLLQAPDMSTTPGILLSLNFQFSVDHLRSSLKTALGFIPHPPTLSILRMH